MATTSSDLPFQQFQIRFVSLFRQGRAMAFPCDEQGWVNINELSERARGNYQLAGAMVGREYATPRVCVA